MSGEVDPLEVIKVFLPIPEESYSIGLGILCLILPIIVSMYFVIQDVKTIVSSNPSYNNAYFPFFVNNTYYLVFGAMVCSLVNMLYTLRKGPEKGDVKNIGFWFTLITICLFALLGCRLSLVISMISITGSDSIIDLDPSDVVYIKTKLEHLTLSIIVCFLLSFIAFFLINGEQMIEIAINLKKLSAAAKAETSGGD